MLQAISEISKRSTHPGKHHVLQLLDHFHHVGPNGNHVCLVFDVLGPHLGHQAVKFERYRTPVKAAKGIARQVLLGLDFLHGECRIIHTVMLSTFFYISLKTSTSTVIL